MLASYPRKYLIATKHPFYLGCEEVKFLLYTLEQALNMLPHPLDKVETLMNNIKLK
jgi:hypothetical protein